MSIFQRAKQAISSNVNALIDKAEDPRKTVELTLEEMKEFIARARQDVIVAVASEKQLRKKCNELKEESSKWEQRAMLAVQAGDDELAREALKQKARIESDCKATEARREEQFGLALKMRDDLQKMEVKYQDYSARKGTIAVRAELAKSGGSHAGLGAGGSTQAFDALRSLEERIDNEEAQAVALRELDSDAIKEAELESKFRTLEKSGSVEPNSSQVENELSALKQRVRIQR